VAALARCAADIRALSLSLVAQGVAARQLTAMISSLNDQLTVRVLELARATRPFGLALCWLGMGSEGRSEQTIATDQDNGLIFVANDEGAAPDAIRERLLPFARSVNSALDRCGYPLCKGEVMAMNPRWCASLAEWEAGFAQWIDRGDPGSLLAASIFFDFRSLWGESRLADLLRDGVAARAKGNPRFLKQLTDNALRNRPPLRWWGDFRTTEDKSGGVGSTSSCRAASRSSTPRGSRARHGNDGDQHRFAAVRPGRGSASAGGDQAWCAAFEYIQLLRLREQHRRARSEDAVRRRTPISCRSPRSPTSTAGSSARHFRQIQNIQQRLELDYPG
jgi:CBS domain-containing protein